jgi:hypothetical protein
MNEQTDPRVASSLRSVPWFIVSFLLMGFGFVLSLSGPDTSILTLFGVVVAALRPETLFTPVWAMLCYAIFRMILPSWMFGKHLASALISGSITFLLLAVVYHQHIVPYLAERRGITVDEQDTWISFHLATIICTVLALLIECGIMRIVTLAGIKKVDRSLET